MRKWQTLHQTYLSNNLPYHRSRQDRVRLPNGHEFTYDVEEYPDWVNGLVLTGDRQVVLVSQYRHAVGDFFLEIPGGMVESGEKPESAIIREVWEETGYRSPDAPLLLGRFYPNPATNTNAVTSYLFLNAYDSGSQNLDTDEDITLHIMPLEEYGHLIHTGQAPQMFSAFVYYLALQALALRDR